MSEDVQRSMHKDRRVAAVEWREGPISETRVCSDRSRRGSCLQVSEERGTRARFLPGRELRPAGPSTSREN